MELDELYANDTHVINIHRICVKYKDMQRLLFALYTNCSRELHGSTSSAWELSNSRNDTMTPEDVRELMKYMKIAN